MIEEKKQDEKKQGKKKRKSRARKTSTVPTLVYAYGAPMFGRDPTRAADRQIVHDQLFAAHKYRNALIDIECTRRKKYRALVTAVAPKLAALETEYDTAQIAYQGARQQLCTVPRAKRNTDPMAVQVRALRAVRDEVYDRLRTERDQTREQLFAQADTAFADLKETRLQEAETAKRNSLGLPETVEGNHLGAWDRRKITAAVRQELHAAQPAIWQQKDQIQIDTSADLLALRKSSGCFSGVYQAVEKAATDSFRKIKGDPYPLRFDHTGLVGVQVPGRLDSDDDNANDDDDANKRHGVTVADAFAGRSNIIRLYTDGRYATAELLLSAKDRNKPVRITVPFIMHRPLPEEAVIKWVYLKASRIGLRTVYEIQFTIEVTRASCGRATKGTLAVNLGWRRLPTSGDIRVATTFDGRGVDQVVLPAIMHDTAQKAERYLGHADDHFNAAKKVVGLWLRGMPKKVKNRLQQGMGYTTLSSIAQWRAHPKLAKLARLLQTTYLTDVDVHAPGTRTKTCACVWCTWRKQRLSRNLDLFASYEELTTWFAGQGYRGDQALALYLVWWSRKDAHLINMARGMLNHVRLRRRELYRVTARRWAEKYQDVVIEKWDKSKTAKSPLPEVDTRTKQDENASTLRQFVGVSILVEALTHTFGKGHVHAEEAAGISQMHASCGEALSNAKGSYMVFCPKCGMVDQDVNAAQILWARHKERERSGDSQSTDPARSAGKPKDSGHLQHSAKSPGQSHLTA